MVTLAFALFDLDALARRRVGRMHMVSMLAYLASFAFPVVWWRAYGASGSDAGAWLFPSAARVGVTTVFVGSRAIATAARTEQRITHPQSHVEHHKTRKPQLTAEELQAAEAYDAQWQAADRERNHRLEHPGPDHTSASHFEHLVQAAIDELPTDIRSQMSNVAVVVEDEPPRGQPFLGLYRGYPLTRRGMGYSGVLPDKISIYRGPIERLYGADPDLLRKEVRRVVWHEVAHHFGISDQRLVDMGRY